MKAYLEIVELKNDIVTTSSDCAMPEVPMPVGNAPEAGCNGVA